MKLETNENSTNGNFALSAEGGTVLMYDQNWYNSADIVPDQVTPASDATPLADSGPGVAGTSNEYSRGDLMHPLQVSTLLPNKDTSFGNISSASTYARSDHQLPVQTADSIPPADIADGSYGIVVAYARNNHSHLINVKTNVSIVPVANGVGNNGTSAYYSRYDHIHPQQLTCDENLTTTKFIKTDGTTNLILCANSEVTMDLVTKTIDQSITGAKILTSTLQAYQFKIPKGTNQEMLMVNGSMKLLALVQQEFYIAGSIQYIKLCTFRAYITPYDVQFEFIYNCQSVFGLIQFNQVYTRDGIRTFQYKLQQNMSYGMDVCYILYFCIGADRYGKLWARVLLRSNKLIFQQANQSIETDPLSDVLISEMQSQIPYSVSSSTALFANSLNSVIHINSRLNDNRAGLRITRQVNRSGIYLGSKLVTVGGYTANQWNIIKLPSNLAQTPLGFTICLGFEATTANKGLRISADGNILSYNDRVL
ncbi:MAG: hypothetical protein EZS28_007593 [Streblomastix strix]|uniref:Uncharacterized protein n=1 Tax=Streblomastix strix TaxID=222440 RepID=A0A5J4WQ96_9EUKA|nr:MAG: hypothetical protein EZS28_007593 [Streblomastix strix]